MLTPANATPRASMPGPSDRGRRVHVDLREDLRREVADLRAHHGHRAAARGLARGDEQGVRGALERPEQSLNSGRPRRPCVLRRGRRRAAPGTVVPGSGSATLRLGRRGLAVGERVAVVHGRRRLGLLALAEVRPDLARRPPRRTWRAPSRGPARLDLATAALAELPADQRRGGDRRRSPSSRRAGGWLIEAGTRRGSSSSAGPSPADGLGDVLVDRRRCSSGRRSWTWAPSAP